MKPILFLYERGRTTALANFINQTELQSFFGLGVPFEQRMITADFTRETYGDQYSAVVIPLLEMPADRKAVIATWLDGSIPACVVNAKNAADFSGYTAGITPGETVGSSQYIDCVLQDVDGKHIGNLIAYAVNGVHKPYTANSSYTKPILLDPVDNSKLWAWVWLGGQYPVVYYAGTITTLPFIFYMLKLAQIDVTFPIGIDMDDADSAETSYAVDVSKIESLLSRANALGGYVLCGFKPSGVAGMPTALRQAYMKYPNAVISIAHDHTGEYWWTDDLITLNYGVWGMKDYDATMVGDQGENADAYGTGKLGALSYGIAHLKAQGWIPNVQDHQHHGGYCFLTNNAASMVGLQALEKDGVRAVRSLGSTAAVESVRLHSPVPSKMQRIIFNDEFGVQKMIYTPGCYVTSADTIAGTIANAINNSMTRALSSRSNASIYLHANNLTNNAAGVARLAYINRYLDIVELCQPVFRLRRPYEEWKTR